MVEDHFFSSEAFLGALAETYFPGAKPELVECDGFTTRTLVYRGRAVTDFFHHPFYHPQVVPDGATRAVNSLRKAELAITVPGDGGPAGAQRAPFMDWRGFGTWEAYERFAAAQGMRTRSLERDERYLCRDFGPVVFSADDDDPAAFDALVRWKVADYSRRNGVNRFNTRQNVEFHRELIRRRLLSVSTLRAGNHLVAVNVVHRWKRQTVDRVTTYDPRFRKYSPGAIHMRYLLRNSFESGDEEFDFLWGEEPYKYRYATHVRWLGDVGSEPRLDRWRRRARMRAGRALRRYPGVYGPAQKVELAARRALGRVVR